MKAKKCLKKFFYKFFPKPLCFIFELFFGTAPMCITGTELKTSNFFTALKKIASD